MSLNERLKDGLEFKGKSEKGQSTPPGIIHTIRSFDLAQRYVFLRLDLNVPLRDKVLYEERQVEDDTRIQEAVPTIQYCIDHGAKVIIASHLGRPEGRKKMEYSLEPVARRLCLFLGKEVTLADDCVGDGIQHLTKGMKEGQVLLLENLRFYKEEELNSLEFSKKLASFAEIYITDAFGTAHRKHSSTYTVPQLMQKKGIGFLIEKELKFLEPLINEPQRPFYAVLGGIKVTDKIKTIEALLKRVDALLIGGGMAKAFLAAIGNPIGALTTPSKPEDVTAAQTLLKEATRLNVKVILPTDTNAGYDIGDETIATFCNFLTRSRTVFWNGPLGWFENPNYEKGTFQVAKNIAELNSLKIVGGGDTVSAIRKAGVGHCFDHLSTGGGAVLEFLEGRGLPGIDILKVPVE